MTSQTQRKTITIVALALVPASLLGLHLGVQSEFEKGRPLLHWGVEASKPVRIALEAGPVAGETPPDRISFLGDEQRMFDVATEVAQAVSGWDSFAGISFHGLSWSLR